MAFIVSEPEQPAIEVCVNFGVFAGRDATEQSSTVSRRGCSTKSARSRSFPRSGWRPTGASRQPCIRSGSRWRTVRADREALAERIVERAEYWAHLCVAERHAEIADDV